VRKGALLVQLDKEPYQVKVDIEQAALTVTQADIVTTQAKVRDLRVWRAAKGSIWQMLCTTSTTKSPTCTPKYSSTVDCFTDFGHFAEKQPYRSSSSPKSRLILAANS
jgi:hypothetical protein